MTRSAVGGENFRCEDLSVEAATAERGKTLHHFGMILAILALALTLRVAVSLVIGQVVKGDLHSNSRLYEKRARIPTTPDLRWEVRAVGVVESPYAEKFGTPKQATISRKDGGAQEGRLRLFPGFEDCIAELEGFDYIWVLTLMHLNKGFKTKIRPQPRAGSVVQPPAEVGLFCSRAPHRPNPIALSCLKITGVDVEKGVITVHGLDLLDDTPILDIKPYIPAFDAFPDARSGWMDCITDDPLDGRVNGYQDIYSSRGMRMMRRNERILREASESGEQEQEQEQEREQDQGQEHEQELERDDEAPPRGTVLSCETTGSCRSTRAALKQEMEERRRVRTTADRADYLETLSTPQQPKSPASKYNPFKRQT